MRKQKQRDSNKLFEEFCEEEEEEKEDQLLGWGWMWVSDSGLMGDLCQGISWCKLTETMEGQDLNKEELFSWTAPLL